ncbi:MAG: hypothetical protein A2W00_02445 [Candidatus Eisenbacteria bacterium RBG_16_71_46]|nr:MAG: hypothetical protein A2W00_02445 [Candidatus Eisenbacteria bacterium RBG_16_71_46]
MKPTRPRRALPLLATLVCACAAFFASDARPLRSADGGEAVASAAAGAARPEAHPRGEASTVSGIGQDGPLALAGLAAPVRIVTDRHGIPHIEAQSLPDLYFAWGFVTARDRLWQIAFNRASAQGERWRWLGNTALRGDAGAKLFEFRALAERAWARERADSAVAPVLARYAAGINAYVGLCRAGRAPWPEEFRRLGVTPDDWRPVDSVLLLYSLGVLLDLDVPELGEAQDIREHGREWTTTRRRFEDGVLYDTVPDSAARRLYGAPAARSARDTPVGALSPAMLADARGLIEAMAPRRAADPDLGASNVFAVGAGRGAGGAPLLANDPHLGLVTPSPFHVVHLTVPGVVNAAGACVPGLPAIVSGRNQRCAWGVTALSADMLDVYADTLSADGRSVRWQGGWAAIRRAPYALSLRWFGIPLPLVGQERRYTPHGPVMAYDRKRGVALSVRWSALTDRVTLARLLGLERSRSAAEVCARFRTLITPGINVVAADVDGAVRYQTVGALPRRGFDPGPGPLPGDGRHEWQGIVAPEQMPAWEAPRDGFVVNSNNRPVGPVYPVRLPRFDWSQDRAQRIAARLAALPRARMGDLESVQNDVVSRRAQRLAPRFVACADSLRATLDPRLAAALDTVRAWDFAARRDRLAPTLFWAWYGALEQRSRLAGLPGLIAAALDGRAPEALRAPGSEAPERAAVAAVEALKLAMKELEPRLGDDPARWTWGRAHRARFAHPLARWVPGIEPDTLAVDGDAGTVCVGRSRLPGSILVTHGPAFRHLVDLAVPESSLAVVPPGNSGERASGHARDLLARWADHGYVPLHLDWERVEAAKETALSLTPAAR